MKERLIPGLVLICLLLIALVVLMTLIPMKSIVDETKRRHAKSNNKKNSVVTKQRNK